jgi:hypothetical protein
MAAVAGAVVATGAHQLDPLVLADFEAGLDGLATNDLIDKAEMDSIVRETTLHAIGDAPWADAKVGAAAMSGQAVGEQLSWLSPSAQHPPAAEPTQLFPSLVAGGCLDFPHY